MDKVRQLIHLGKITAGTVVGTGVGIPMMTASPSLFGRFARFRFCGAICPARLHRNIETGAGQSQKRIYIPLI